MSDGTLHTATLILPGTTTKRALGDFLGNVVLPYSTKTAAFSLVTGTSGIVFDNAGATGEVVFTLPVHASIPPGTWFGFYVAAAQSLKVKAGTGATVRVAASSGGTATSNVVGNYVEFVCRAQGGTTWVAKSVIGTWTVATVSAEVEQFLSRTSGLDATHTNAYTALIDGVVADGIWPKLDALYTFATQDATTARLNLRQSIYNCVLVGTPAFLAERGYVSATVGHYVNTGLTPYFGGTQYTRNAAHMSCWLCDTSPATPYFNTVGASGTASVCRQYITPRYNLTNTAYYRVNTQTGPEGTVPSAEGFSLANRSDASTSQGYHNGTLIGSDTDASAAFTTAVTFTFPDQVIPDTAARCAGGTFGGALTAGEVANLYARLRTYMTAVGVP